MKWSESQLSRVPSKIVIGSVILAALLVTWLYGVSNSFYRATELTRSRHMDLERLGAAVNHLDEAILMATYLGAVSGDSNWLSQHNNLSEQRDEAFGKLLDVAADLGLEQARGVVTRAKERLKEIENRIIGAAVSGDLEKAENLFSSQRFWAERRAHGAALRTLRTELATSFASLLEEQQRKARWSMNLALGILAVIAGSGIAMVLAIRGRDAAVAEESKQRRQAEERLSESEGRLRSLVSNVPGAVYRCRADEEWTTVHMSRGIEELSGYPLADFIDNRSQSMLSIVHPEDRAGLLEISDRSMQSKAPFQHVYRIRRANGETRWIDDRGVNVLDENGNVTHFDGIMFDVTDQKNSEAELRRARDRADDASRAKSEFLASMSHEIRTPLNGMIGMTSLLKGTEPTDEQLPFINLLSESSESLLELVNDILDFSKIEAGRLEIEETAYSPADIVSAVVELLASKAHAKNVEIGAYVSRDVPLTVTGDPGRVRQILLNLVGNAVKFTETGGIAVTLGIEKDNAAQDQLNFEVRDTGIGIPPKSVPRLFQRFTQLDGSMSRRFGGTGLGLAICKELIDLMEGSIAVSSTPGEGSTFSVSLPIIDSLSEVPDAETQQAIDRWRGKRAFIADGNPVSRDLLKRTLADMGLLPVTFESAKALEDLSRDEPVSAKESLFIVSDNLEDRDAQATARTLREQNVSEKSPIVLCSVSTNTRQSGGNLSSVFDAGLRKPLTPKALVTLFKELESVPDGAKEARQSKGGGMGMLQIGDRSIDVLLVEDNKVNQLLAVNILEQGGFQTAIAENGQQALEYLKARTFDLVLLDIQMPIMDGFETARAIRQLPEPENAVPIVALTANAMKGDRERCLEAGMNDYIAKPIQPHQLTEKLARWCGMKMEQTPDDGLAPVAASPGREVPGPTSESLLELLAALDELAESWEQGRKRPH